MGRTVLDGARVGGTWFVDRARGYTRPVTTQEAYGRTKAEAAAELARKLGQHERRADLGDVADWSVADLLDWWITEIVPARVANGRLADTTAEGYERAVRLHLRDRCAGIPFVECRAAHVHRLMGQLARDGAQPSHRVWLQAVLQGAFSAAVRMELRQGNPVSLVEPPRLVEQRRPGVTLEHARKLLAAAQGDEREALWRLMLSAPMRIGEPLGAVWDDFDLDVGVFHFRRNLVRTRADQGALRWRFHDGKSHRPRDLSLSAAAVSALRAHRVSQVEQRVRAGPAWVGARVVDVDGRTVVRPQLVFSTATGEPVDRKRPLAALTRLCATAQVPRLTPRDLRHAAVTLLQDADVHPAIVQQLAGHATPAMTDHYTGVLDRACREAVDRLARRLDGHSG
ncbi:MAG: tyrosine-type recombinase/integrase [Egibacteraceae bacterium]